MHKLRALAEKGGVKVIDRGDYDKRTCLHVAACDGCSAAVECLVELGAKLSLEDRWGNTPLDDAVQSGRDEVVAYLKNRGATHSGGFAARSAASVRSAAASGDVATLRQLAPHTDVNAGNYEQRTPLHLAASGGSLEAVQCLLALGASASPLDSTGNTPLDDAMLKGHVDSVAALEARGAYRGVSFRQLKRRPTTPTVCKSRPSSELQVSLSLGEHAENFAAFCEEGLVALGSELEIEIAGATAQPKPGVAGCLGPAIVGNFSCHGADSNRQGLAFAKRNQDCSCAVNPVAGDDASALFAVFDGHGKHGHLVSKESLCAMHFELDRSASLSADPAATLTDAFEAVQAHLRRLVSQPDVMVPAKESGACALVAILTSEVLTVAGAGDCRAVLGTELADGTMHAAELSVDHKADDPAEKARIEEAGGYVSPSHGSSNDDDYVPARMYECASERWRGPGLTMSRALGDTEAEACGLLPTPTVMTRARTAEDRFLILASDGIWEFIQSGEAVEIVERAFRSGMAASEAAQELIMRAVLRWAQVEGAYRDDISAIVVYLPATVAALSARKAPADLS